MLTGATMTERRYFPVLVLARAYYRSQRRALEIMEHMEKNTNNSWLLIGRIRSTNVFTILSSIEDRLRLDVDARATVAACVEQTPEGPFRPLTSPTGLSPSGQHIRRVWCRSRTSSAYVPCRIFRSSAPWRWN